MATKVQTSTPPNTMEPIGPYSHIAVVGEMISIGAVAGVNPQTGELAGPDVAAQTRQIVEAFEVMLGSVGSDLEHVVHVTVFLTSMDDFAEMNAAYAEKLGDHRPTRSAVAVLELPKPGALVTMSLTAVTRG